MQKLGIIGCGYWGKNYLRIFSRLPGSTVEGVCDKDSSILEEIGKEYPSINRFNNHVEMMESVSMNAVVVATPPSDHYDPARKALESGLDVLIEKPMTLNDTESKHLVECAGNRGKILMVGFTFLYNDAISTMKKLADKDTVGEIYYLHARRTHLGLIRPDVNTMWDLAPHDIAIFTFLLDRLPIQVSAVGGSYLKQGKPDVAFINLVYPGNIIGNVHVSWLDSVKVREVALVGSKMKLVFDDLNNLEKLRIFKKGASVDRRVEDFGEFQYLLRDGDIVSPKLELNEPLKNQCLHFLECIKTRQSPRTDGNTGLTITRICKAIDQSMEKHGYPVELDWE